LELRALATALRSGGRAKEQAIEQALQFRLARLRAFPEARAQEHALDRNEGLAAYTGVRLGASSPETYAARILDRYDAQESYVRSYAYATGPAYGLLLDQFVDGWREQVRAGAVPAELLANALRVQPERARRVERMGERFGRTTIVAEEAARADTNRLRLLALRTRFARGPRLEVALSHAQFEFDPNLVTAIEGLGAHYPILSLRDSWGELQATDGAVIAADFSKVILAEPTADGLSGPGWSIDLSTDYHVAGPDPAGVRWVEATPVAP
jgi:hypothetical protein